MPYVGFAFVNAHSKSGERNTFMMMYQIWYSSLRCPLHITFPPHSHGYSVIRQISIMSMSCKTGSASYSVMYTIYHAFGTTFLSSAPNDTMIVTYSPTMPTLPSWLSHCATSSVSP